VSLNIPESHFEVIFKHDYPPAEGIYDKREDGSKHMLPVPEAGFSDPLHGYEVLEFFAKVLFNENLVL